MDIKKRSPFCTLFSLWLFIIPFLSLNTFAEMQSEKAYPPLALLQRAILEGKTQTVQTLIEEGVNVNHLMADEIFPIHASVLQNQEDIVLLLLKAGANPNLPEPATLATALHIAALYGREKMAVKLIQHGAKLNARMQYDLTPLLVAVRFNQVQMVQLFIDRKVNLNEADAEGFTALHVAAEAGNEIITRLLIEAGADLNVRDKTQKRTPLALAIEHNHFSIVHLLKEHSAQIGETNL